ncbi:hypothetical protein J6590_006495 [Homalodisca vitripennis]|nr:hypothetical protein J6590_006495 [Homalodisca vitripennis]
MCLPSEMLPVCPQWNVLTRGMIHKMLAQSEPQYLSRRLVSGRRSLNAVSMADTASLSKFRRRSFSYFGRKLYGNLYLKPQTCRLLVVLISTSELLMRQGATSLAKLYIDFSWVFFWCQTFLAATTIALKHKSVSRLSIFMNTIDQQTKSHVRRKDRILMKALKIFLSGEILFGIIISIHDSSSSFIKLFGKDLTLASLIFVIPTWPEFIFAWAFSYNLILLFIMELQFLLSLISEISIQYEPEGLTSVLPVVEVNKPKIYWVSGQGTSQSIHRCSPWYCRLHRCRQMSKTCSNVKMLHFLISQLYNVPYSLQLLAKVTLLPFVFVPAYHGSEEYATVTLYGSAAFYNVFWVAKMITPIFLNQWITYRVEKMVCIVSRDLFNEQDTEKRNILCRLSLSLDDSYSDSPWSLFNLDYSLLSDIIELVVLLGTSFIIT